MLFYVWAHGRVWTHLNHPFDIHLIIQSHVCVCVLTKLFQSYPTLATPWTVAHQAPLSIGFPRQEYWSGLPFPPAEDLPEPVIKLGLLPLLHWQANSLPLSHLGS